MTTLTADRCRASVLGLVCALPAHGEDRDHHMVAGHCPTHGRPLTRRRDPRTGYPRCGQCGLELVPVGEARS